MRRSAVSASLLLVAVAIALAGGKREVVIRGVSFPPAVALVVDASGSMIGATYGRAVHEARRIAMLVSDEGALRFYAFGDELYADEQGWFKTPDEEALQRAMIFLHKSGPSGPGVSTDLTGAMERVLADPKEFFGVVIITDAAPDDGARKSAEAILALNQKRASPAIIGVVAFNPATNGEPLGRLLCGETQGAYTRITDK